MATQKSRRAKAVKSPKSLKSSKPARPQRVLWPLFMVFVVIGLVALLLTHVFNDRVAHKSNRAADIHAEAAANYMDDRTGVEASANDLAYRVVGHAGDTTIEALEAQGSNFDGTVTLRITVSNDSGIFGSADQSRQCYGYHFQQYQAVNYSRLNYCTNDPALQLKQPAISTYNPKTAP